MLLQSGTTRVMVELLQDLFRRLLCNTDGELEEGETALGLATLGWDSGEVVLLTVEWYIAMLNINAQVHKLQLYLLV